MIRRFGRCLLIVTLLLTFFPAKGFTEMTKNEKIVSIAKQQLGVPYRFGGSSPSGFDCSGFLYYVFNEVGITLPRTSSDQYDIGEKVKKSELQVGDLVFFETYRRGPSHSGIYVGDNKFIHASSSNGISISSINDPHYWSSRYLGARRIVDEPVQVVLAALPKGEYHDVPEDHWAYHKITWLSQQGIVNGYDQSLFLPNEVISRSQAAVIISNTLGLNTSNVSTGFSDIPDNHWAAGAITATTEKGFFSGFEGNEFRPQDVLTREQIAVLLSRVFELKNDDQKMATFTDVDDQSWAYHAIQLVNANGIATGYSDNTYRPKQEVTRAEFSVFLYRALHTK